MEGTLSPLKKMTGWDQLYPQNVEIMARKVEGSVPPLEKVIGRLYPLNYANVVMYSVDMRQSGWLIVNCT